MAMKPFHLADGTRVEVGDWTVTPVASMMQTHSHYPDPLAFNGFRFVDPLLLNAKAAAVSKVSQPEPSKLTDMSSDFHVWGTGRQAWYVIMHDYLLQATPILTYSILSLIRSISHHPHNFRRRLLFLSLSLFPFSTFFPLSSSSKHYHPSPL